MANKRIEKQRRAIESKLMKIAEISQEVDPIMSKERHTKGLAYRSLGGQNKGWILHYKNGGFVGEYNDQNGQKYEIKVAPQSQVSKVNKNMTNKIEFPRDMSFVDRQGNVVRPSREDYNPRKSAKIGKAYGFFNCDASRQEINEYMPDIRHMARTPRGLQMLLHEGISGLQLDERLAEQIQYPDDYRVMSSERIKQRYEEERKPLSSMKYSLVANYKGASNEDVANELGDVMNVIHRRFNRDQGIFRGAVVYEKNGEYQLRE